MDKVILEIIKFSLLSAWSIVFLQILAYTFYKLRIKSMRKKLSDEEIRQRIVELGHLDTIIRKLKNITLVSILFSLFVIFTNSIMFLVLPSFREALLNVIFFVVALPLLSHFSKLIILQREEHRFRKLEVDKVHLIGVGEATTYEDAVLVKEILRLFKSIDLNRHCDGFYFDNLLLSDQIKFPSLKVLRQGEIFWEGIQDYIRSYNEERLKLKHSTFAINQRKQLANIIIIVALVVAGTTFYVSIQENSFIITVILTLAAEFLFVYPIAIYGTIKINSNLRNKLGQGQDSELKSQAQKIIDYTKNFLTENGLDSKDFPIDLRHDDYEGLTYEEKGKGKFIAYLQV